MPIEAANEAAFFPERLRDLRNKAGQTQVGLAEKAGMSISGVVRLETGEHMPSWETVLRLAKALGVKVSAFTKPPAGPVAPPKRGRPKKEI